MTAYRACPARCGARVIYAITRAGKRQVLNWMPDGTGNVAAYQDVTGTWHARTAGLDERLTPPEKRYMPHWATSPACSPARIGQQRQAGQAVRDELAAYRARRGQRVQLTLIPLPRASGARTATPSRGDGLTPTGGGTP